MRQGLRRGLALLLLLPSAGCVFAVGADDEACDDLRDRVRALERRIDRLEGAPGPSGFLRHPAPDAPPPPPPPKPPEKAR